MHKIRKYYAETDAGLIHIQEAGTGPKTLLFIDITSWGSVLMDDALPKFAERGYRALNLDIMGYGRSDKRVGDWTIENFAANIKQAVSWADAPPDGVIAGHMAALIGIELACGAPQGLRGLVIEGTPILAPDVRETNRRAAPAAPTVWTEDGAHAVEYWKRIYRLVKLLDPQFALTADPGPKLRAAYIAYLEVACFEPGTMFAVAHYEIEQRLRRITLPVLAMCGDNDWNLKYHDQVLSHLRDGSAFRWAGTHPLHDMTSPDRSRDYVDAIDRFFAPL